MALSGTLSPSVRILLVIQVRQRLYSLASSDSPEKVRRPVDSVELMAFMLNRAGSYLPGAPAFRGSATNHKTTRVESYRHPRARVAFSSAKCGPCGTKGIRVEAFMLAFNIYIYIFMELQREDSKTVMASSKMASKAFES